MAALARYPSPMTVYDIKPGPRDLITDVGDLRVGQAEDETAKTGVTVVLPDKACVMACDVRGGAPGTRDTDALDPASLVDAFHGIVLAGGSVFGLAAADAVTAWLSARDVGLPLGSVPVPVVPAAILFDLANGGDKDWSAGSPYPRLGVAACENAGVEFSEGRAGAGYGAQAGSGPGGIGSASAVAEDGTIAGALVAVNAFGNVGQEHNLEKIDFPKAGLVGGNTTIAVVATNLAIDKAGAKRIAIMAHDGMARAIRPLHTPFDGDIVFALATGKIAVDQSRGHMAIALAGTMAADCLTRAICKAVAPDPG